MSNADSNPQLDLFEDKVSKIIDIILSCPQQPSAQELLQLCQETVGPDARDNLKEAVILLIERKQTPALKREYLRCLIQDKSLDKAIAGKQENHDRREIVTGIDTLVEQSRAHRNSKSFQELIEFMGKFRDYSPYNNMLVRVQNPSCSFYATAPDWKKRFSRHLKEDARPMLILAPMHPVMLVYDIDQTEGQDLPNGYNDFARFEGDWKQTWIEKLTENSNRYKIRIDYKTLSSSNAGFATLVTQSDDWKMRIAIHEELDAPSRFGVLCHELAHIFLGHLSGDKDMWWPSRVNLNHSAIEVEAEATAFIVTSRFGLDGSSAAYVSTYLKYGNNLPEGVSLDNIGKASAKIWQMAKGLVAKPKEKQAGQKR